MTALNELTREQILAMPAGREMDAYVAEAMGWTFRERTGMVDELILLVYSPGGERCEYNFGNRRFDPISGKPVDLAVDWNDVNCLPCYSTDIATAMDLLTELEKKWPIVGVACEWKDTVTRECYWMIDQYMQSAKADTYELAICRAFLLATLEGDEK